MDSNVTSKAVDAVVPLPFSEPNLGIGTGPEAARSAAVGPGPVSKFERPDVEVRPRRRRFSADEKLRILREVDRCKERGAVGALLRREGIYSSLLVRWRQERDERARAHLDKKRGRKAAPFNPLAEENHKLRKQLARTEAELVKARAVIDLQKKAALILGEPYWPDVKNDND
jgi:transposase-like protein